VGGILAVDSAMNRLLLYSPSGRARILPQPEEQLPALLTSAGDRVYLKLVGKDVVSFDAETLDDSHPHSLLKSANTPLGALSAVYQWAGLKDSILAVGLVRGKTLPGGYQTGLFRLPLDESAAKATSLVMKLDAWDYYVLGYQYVTATEGGSGYFLEIDHGTAHLFEIPPGGSARELKGAVPPEMRTVPVIDAAMNGPQDAPALFAKLAQMQMPTGIYGGPDGNIYLLGREVAKDGNDWWLFRISSAGTLLGKTLLPSNAKHLSIVVSPDTFYLIERGDVNPYGGQDIHSMVTVPANILERMTLQGTRVCASLRQ
jgi:hypothetical protein